jgi:hypothetical protein
MLGNLPPHPALSKKSLPLEGWGKAGVIKEIISQPEEKRRKRWG